MENTPAASLRPTRTVLSLLTAIGCVEAPLWIANRGILVGSSLASASLPSLLLATMFVANLLSMGLGLVRSVVFFVAVHRLFANAIARGAYLRVSATRAVVHYFVPVLNLFAPRRDLLELLEVVSREAKGSLVAAHARSTVNRWWVAYVGASLASLVAFYVPRGALTQVVGVISVTLTVASIVLSIRVLRLVETRIECFDAELASTFA